MSDKNSVCSNDEEKEEVVEEEEVVDEEDDEEDEEEEEDDDEEEDGEEEYDQNIINFELFKSAFIDENGNNVATHLSSISQELHTLNKILKKYTSA
jgi:hypothetical protein